ncbi:MAG: AAA-like domain-containing protein [Chloroflexota bacterium]
MTQPQWDRQPFFVVGGTVRPDSPSYVERPADEELFQLVRAGHFCYILATRQMGKSSLMIKADRRLQAEGIRTIKIDLTLIGTQDVTLDQWYLGILTLLKRRLKLSVDPEDWWRKWSALSTIHRFTTFLKDVALTEIGTDIVIFIDEIDSTLKLDFTDDFFAAIRATYNARADEPIFNRLTFVLLGVATPADLIQDTVRTPFNIGYGIDLHEFRQSDAQVFENGLTRVQLGQAHSLLSRVLYWTNGHPYLTQKICKTITDTPNQTWTDDDVDALIHRLFLSDEGRQEENLQFIQAYIDRNPRRIELLRLYRKIYKGRQILEDKRSIEQNYLKLSGLVRPRRGEFEIRNEIYRRAFNLDWVKAHLPVDLSLRIAIISTAVTLFLIFALVLSTWRQSQNTTEVLAQTHISNFNDTTDPILRLDSLAKLFDLPEGEFHNRARVLFNSLTLEEKTDLFKNNVVGLQPQVRSVVHNTYAFLENTPPQNNLLREMGRALDQSKELESVITANEIARWVDGRIAVLEGRYEAAKTAYSSAVDLNDSNPATRFERGIIFTHLHEYHNALADFEAALRQQEQWATRVSTVITDEPQLYATWQTDTEQNLEPTYTSLSRLISIQTIAVAISSQTPTATHTNPSTATETTSPTPTETSTHTPTATPTSTPTSSPTLSPTASPTTSPTASPTASATTQAVPKDVVVWTATPSPTKTKIPTTSPTSTVAPTRTPTVSATSSPTPSPTRTPTASPTMTVTPLPTHTSTSQVSENQAISRIVYAQGRREYHDLAMIRANGTFVRVILPKQASAPAWSPDGLSIAFFGEPSIDSIDDSFRGGEGLWTIDWRGRNPRQLVKTDHIKNIAWSPDGTKLAFEVNPPTQIAQVIVIDAETAIPLSRFSGEQPNWEPNSRRLVVKACLPTCGLWRITTDGSERRILTAGGSASYPAWSPDGLSLVFSAEQDGNWDLYLLRFLNGEIERLTDAVGIDTTPAFSRDGKNIIYRASTTDMTWRLLRLRLSDRRRFLIKNDVGDSNDWGQARPAVY